MLNRYLDVKVSDTTMVSKETKVGSKVNLLSIPHWISNNNWNCPLVCS